MRRLLILSLVWIACGVAPLAAQSPLPLDRITLPPGFRIDIYAAGLPNARSLALGDEGTVFVGTRQYGTVYALPDADGDGRADSVVVVDQGLNQPNGVAFRDGALYVATATRILRYDAIESSLDSPPEPAVVYDGLPAGQTHSWKYLRFGPDGLLYVPVGVPCNVCAEQSGFGVILRLNADGTGLETVASGVRNTVGFDWDPLTGDLWFTDNGRDWISDDLPPDELNHAPEVGLHFGFPYCHAGTLPDTDFAAGRACDEFTPPAMPLGPHVAALGMRFYTGDAFPAEYHNQIFIAEHGSWNRTTPLGYRVTLVRLDDNRQAVAYEVFAEGWLQPNGQFWGRPVDLVNMPDGSLLLSDDVAGAVYRISYDAAT